MKKEFLKQQTMMAIQPIIIVVQQKTIMLSYNGIICSVMVCSNISFDICMKQVSMKEWRKRFEL